MKKILITPDKMKTFLEKLQKNQDYAEITLDIQKGVIGIVRMTLKLKNIDKYIDNDT